MLIKESKVFHLFKNSGFSLAYFYYRKNEAGRVIKIEGWVIYKECKIIFWREKAGNL
jgi:hypothetical protein